MKCANGHDALPVSEGPDPMASQLAEESEDWGFCPQCPYRGGRGHILGYGIFFNIKTSAEAHQTGQGQSNEVHP